MLIIDLNNNRISNQRNIEPDTMLIQGASIELMRSIENAAQEYLTNPARVKDVSRKVALAGRGCCSSSAGSKSVTADFATVYNSIKNAVSTAFKGKKPARAARTSVQQSTKALNETSRARRTLTLQAELATLLTSDNDFVEHLRTAVQSGIMNPLGYVVTTRNIRAAIAMYCYYTTDTGFSSTESVKQIAKHVQVGTDLVSRLATSLHILRKSGSSTATRYYISRSFESLLMEVLNTDKHSILLADSLEIQDRLDNI